MRVSPKVISYQPKEFVMQKKIIALAVAGLMSGAAFAQSNVTVYGVVDAGYRASSGDNNTAGGVDTQTGIASGNWKSSRLGFKGEEALGNGLKAIFTLEYSISNDVNEGIGTASGTKARTQLVGLSGDFGTAVAGRINSPGKTVHDKYDVMTGSTAFSASQTINGSISATSTSGTIVNPNSNTLALQGVVGAGSTINARLSNTAAYVSPTLMGGLTLTAAYSFGGATETDTNSYNGTGNDNDQERIIGFSADYSAGPLGLAYVYHKVNDFGTAQGSLTYNNGNAATGLPGASQTENMVVGSYDFGVVRLMASYLDISTNPTGALQSSLFDRDVWSVGAAAPLGGGVLRASYAALDWSYSSTANNVDANSWTLAYTYDLSKRTTMYAGYTRVSNDSSSNLKVFSNGGATTSGGENSTGYALGMSHSF
jgi:predicted porin